MNDLLKVIDRFVHSHMDPKRPILVGLSGGVDSLALFETLHAYPHLNIAVAHVDHGWRKESSQEAQALKEYVESKNVPFHSLTLNPESLTGNLEDACREFRYAFFRKLCDEYGYQGVVTGHHAQDQVETVIKRIFEGASLKNLGGIRPVRILFGVTVFRPFLCVEKKQLENATQDLSFSPFHDPSNLDTKFLRARMRKTIVPFLQEQFGKNVTTNILCFSKEMQEVNEYLDAKIEPYLSAVVEGAMGSYLDLQTNRPSHILEIKQLVKTFLNHLQVSVSKRQRDTLIDLLMEKKANKIIETADQNLLVDRGIVFFLNNKIKKLSLPKQSIQLGSQQWGQWTITTKKGDCSNTSSWRDCWKGEMTVSLPEGNYEIGYATTQSPYKKNISIAKWWSDHKAPAFFKEYVPVIWKDDGVAHEFLTGSPKKQSEKNQLIISLSILTRSP
jgi:tRNA(Ile)-lysidine synthase